MTEFHRLDWDLSFDGPWSVSAERRYVEGGFDGLILRNSFETIPDLEFLRGLPGLRSLAVQARVKDDTSAFLIPGLEDLSLVTGSRARIPDVVQPSLRNLVMTYRPGIDVASRWPMLESFQLGMWRSADLQLLGKAENLVRFRAEGRRQKGSLDGIEECSAVEQLISVNCSISSTAPLRGLSELSELKLMSAPPSSPHGMIDIADLANSRLRKLWISNAPVFQHVEVLLEIPSLREVRLIGSHLSDADLRVLDVLSARARVEIIL